MTARRRSIGAAILTVAVAACGTPPRRDVVIVTLDTVRADRLGCYGHAGANTPHLDRLAAQGVLFEDASCATPITLPSHATIFTGRYPTATGVRNNGTFVVPGSETTLAEVLKAAGWRTGAVIASYPLLSRYGLSQGFDVYDEDLPDVGAGGGAGSLFFPERDARAVTDRALSVWSRLGTGPRFLWVHYFDAHAPYAPPMPWGASHAEHPYDGEIAYVDAELGRLLAGIERDAPEAIVVVVADHGESLGEHGEKTHGIFVYQSTVRVPFVVRAPGAWPAGSRVSAPVSLADTFPTVLKLVGLGSPSGLDGADLSGLAAGGPSPAREVYAESYLPRLQFRFSALTMLRRGPLKLIDAPSVEIYDLRQDPAEARNLAGGHPEQSALGERLAAFVARADPDASQRAAGALDAEAEAKLRSLGYASAGTLHRADDGRGRDPKTMTSYLERYDRALGLIGSERREDGLEELRRLVPEAPENFMARYQLAAALLLAGHADEARVEVERVVEADPAFWSAHMLLAECLAAGGRIDDAVRSFEAAAVLAPSQAAPKLAQGRALETRGRFDAAAEAYRQAIEREPGSDEPARALLALRIGRGDLGRASSELRQLAARFPTSANLQVVLAEALRRQGDPAGSAEAIGRAAALDPGRPDVRVFQAESLLAAGRAREAIAAFRALLADRPDLRRAQIGLGRALVAADDSAAASWIEALVAERPRDASALALRGLLLERGGDAAGALAAFRSALALDPGDPDARRGIDRITRR